MERLIDIDSESVASFLDILLADKTTRRNIIWATNTYEALGRGFTDKEQMNRTLLLQHADLIRPRIQKSQEEQAAQVAQARGAKFGVLAVSSIFKLRDKLLRREGSLLGAKIIARLTVLLTKIIPIVTIESRGL